MYWWLAKSWVKSKFNSHPDVRETDRDLEFWYGRWNDDV